MRQNPNGKRSRGRGGRKGPNPRVQVFDSNGPGVRVRGNAVQIYEKYLQLARDASSSGDRVAAENLLQHAEHYYRLSSAFGPREGFERDGNRYGGERGEERFEGDGERAGDRDIDRFEPARGEGERYDADRQRDDRPRDDRQRDERPREDRPRDDRPRDDRQRDDRPRGDDRQREDRQRDERPRGDDRQREDRSRDRDERRNFEPRGNGRGDQRSERGGGEEALPARYLPPRDTVRTEATPIEAEEAEVSAVVVAPDLPDTSEDTAAPIAAREDEDVAAPNGRPRRRRLRIRHGEERPVEPREEQDPAA